MNLDMIWEFIAIEKYGSFSHAADELYISQSSLSKHMKALEHDLGVKLFERSTSKVWTTPAGKQFLAFAKQVELHYKEMQENLSQFESTISSQIRLGSIPIMSVIDISSSFVQFQTKHPCFHIELFVREQKKIRKLLDNGEIDCALIRMDHIQHDRYDAVPVMLDRMVLLCPSNHPYANSKHLSISCMENQSIVSLDPQSVIYHILMRECKKHQFTPEISFYTSNHLHLLKMVAHGFGIALLPEKLVEFPDEYGIKVIPLEEEIFTTIGLVKIKDRDQHYSTNRLWEFFEEIKMKAD